MIEYADARSATTAIFRQAHPSVIAAVNRRRAAMGLSPIDVRGNPNARPIQRRGSSPTRAPAVSPRLSPQARLTASKHRAAAAIARLRRVLAVR